MSPRPILRSAGALALAVALALGLLACGSEIGDSCAQSTECAQDGTRYCDRTSDTSNGYCTILGCDHDTCPDEAVCVRFFTGTFANKPCDPGTEDDSTDACSPDEACGVEGYCALRSSESRYCMKKCDDSGDCRDHYQCRDLAGMRMYGGEPVLAAGKRASDDPQRFCAFVPAP